MNLSKIFKGERKIVFLVMIVYFLGVLVGCGTVKYNIPLDRPLGSERKIVINKGKDEVWNKLLQGVAERFFSINNIEKDSGFMNLSFRADNAELYVNCGDFVAMGKKIPVADCGISKHGNYSSGIWVFKSCETDANGRINILIQEISKNKSFIFVDIKFAVSHSTNLWNSWNGSSMYNNTVIVFDSNNTGTNNGITCVSTGVLEKEVLSIIDDLIKRE